MVTWRCSYRRGISNEQICVLVAQDRNRQMISEIAGTGRIKSTEIDRVLGQYIDNNALLFSVETKYIKFAANNGLKHEIVNIRKGIYVKKSIYHIQHVNAYHNRLKKFIQRFQGVASKYLDNYLFWFKYIDQTKTVAKTERVKQLLLGSCRKSYVSSLSTIPFNGLWPNDQMALRILCLQ